MGLTKPELAKAGFMEEASFDDKIKIEEKEEDLTLIQGIIDVFWMEEDGIVLLDYKTDYVERKEELVMRYAAQMNLYTNALNRVFQETGKTVKEKLIYAFRFDSVIAVD